jgi:hypothetical protein
MAPGGWLGDGSLHHGERSGAIIGEGIADGQAGDIRMDPFGFGPAITGGSASITL